ncbi:hypothetical protein PR048_004555 [Dryococelus australis]|uniref:Uncharacterized protein n=1 Tax=Dryococelus australis TaxID=614101 RepID=A0ABQ9I5R6_9NEOP|nr:hypothetical protein PR048_004555 [Dryococelus australis]
MPEACGIVLCTPRVSNVARLWIMYNSPHTPENTALSPDMDPIENFWQELEDRITKRITIKTRLKEISLQEWHKLDSYLTRKHNCLMRIVASALRNPLANNTNWGPCYPLVMSRSFTCLVKLRTGVCLFKTSVGVKLKWCNPLNSCRCCPPHPSSQKSAFSPENSFYPRPCTPSTHYHRSVDRRIERREAWFQENIHCIRRAIDSTSNKEESRVKCTRTCQGNRSDLGGESFVERTSVVDKPYLSKNKRPRFQFATDYADKSFDFQKTGKSSDENNCNMFLSDEVSIWRKPNTELAERNLQPANNVDQDVYLNILRKELTPSAEEVDLRDCFTFYQDNDPKHTAHKVRIRSEVHRWTGQLPPSERLLKWDDPEMLVVQGIVKCRAGGVQIDAPSATPRRQAARDDRTSGSPPGINTVRPLCEGLDPPASLIYALKRIYLPSRTTCLPPTRIGLDSRWGRSLIFACENRAGRCRWSAGFLGNLLFPPPPLHSDAAPYSLCICSQDLNSCIATDVSPWRTDVFPHPAETPSRLPPDSLARVRFQRGEFPAAELWKHLYCATTYERSRCLEISSAADEVSTKQRRNVRAGGGGTEDTRENPPTNGIVRNDSHMRKLGSKTVGNRDATCGKLGSCCSHQCNRKGVLRKDVWKRGGGGDRSWKGLGLKLVRTKSEAPSRPEEASERNNKNEVWVVGIPTKGSSVLAEGKVESSPERPRRLTTQSQWLASCLTIRLRDAISTLRIGQGPRLVQRLVVAPYQRPTGFDSRRSRSRIFARGNSGRRCWFGEFSRGSPVSPVLAFRGCSILTSLHNNIKMHSNRLACPPPTKANRVTGSSHVGIVPDDAVGRRVFSGISRFSRPFIPAQPPVTLVGSRDLATASPWPVWFLGRGGGGVDVKPVGKHLWCARSIPQEPRGVVGAQSVSRRSIGNSTARRVGIGCYRSHFIVNSLCSRCYTRWSIESSCHPRPDFHSLPGYNPSSLAHTLLRLVRAILVVFSGYP